MKLLEPSAGPIVAYLDSFLLSRVLRDRQVRPCDAHRPEAAKRLAMEAFILHSRGFSCELASRYANLKY